ncbi:MAG: chemotaxis protein CheB [Candidatus Scalindua sp.]|nr:chemotaxis protein CheB [Candidatus Scalindua sp.]MBT5303482.1 chemotaxis protein CheB [Candidatus Scalindua sp.]MBT6052809.1 chemotaxis protein CheB [Candidatus Scalindua sp.]MBT6231037.1 chemotaxis protein CheB [Candidatus Scalindua sp.]MBT6563391.1 chemotaxis protein CheB [Candidatus Scalindua sp.]
MTQKSNNDYITNNHKYKVIVIGVSTGGIKALKTILSVLPSKFELSVIIVMHRHKDADGYLEQLLDNECKMRVKQADEKEEITAGVVYVAPPNYHLLIEDDGVFSMSVEGAVNYARPSVDVVFESAAEVYGKGLIGVVLTGANKDGSQGLKIIKEAGGLAIVQKPETSEVSDMPRAAIAAVKPDYVLPLEKIGPLLRKLESNG